MNFSQMNQRQILRAWLRTTWIGWVLGVPCIVVLALLGEALGIGGVQFLVGAGMGAGIGYMQSRVLRGVLDKPATWFWASLLGLALPFLVTDIAKALEWNLPYSLYVCVAIGGLLVGVWQTLMLRPRFDKVAWWIVASLAGWSAASGMAALAQIQSLRGLVGALAYLAIVAAGGGVLGLVTGAAWAWLLKPKLVMNP